MLQKQRLILEEASISVAASNDEVHFGVGKLGRLSLESYSELRAGRYDIDKIGAYSYMGGGNTIMRNISSVGRFCSIASNIIAGQVEHPTNEISSHYLFQGFWGRLKHVQEFYDNTPAWKKSRASFDKKYGDESQNIEFGNDVWIGEGVFIRRGVKIGDGAVVGARSVVVKDVKPYEIVGGVPAKHIRYRFTPGQIARLQKIEWWQYGLKLIEGVDFTNVDVALDQMEAKLESGDIKPEKFDTAVIEPTGEVIIHSAAE
jgi:acetyltransferase-like isoleucine patch superfamily enzyme